MKSMNIFIWLMSLTLKYLLIFTMTILSSIGSAMATPVIVGGFEAGAADVYSALNHLEDDGEITISTDQNSIMCDQLSVADTSCIFALTADSTLSQDQTYIIIGGQLATMIYNELDVKPVVRIGATTKKVANLTCSQASDRNRTIKCVLSQIMATIIDIPTEEMGL